MCGIAGVFNYSNGKPVDKDLLWSMSKVISHRGPDDDGMYISDDGSLGLVHRRLSIIDLEGGIQPMSTVDKSIWIVFNGEIYNFPELKQELLDDGYKFHTNCDTEVIMVMYQKYGEDAWEKLNGIFAFALYDTNKRCLILVRDHFGVKPLYYAFVNNSLLFGSELKSILEYQGYQRSVDLTALNSFLTYRYSPAPQTLLKDVKKLEPTHYLKVDANGKITKQHYWNYRPKTVNISEEEAVEKYQYYLEQAVRRQLLSDVPVGLFLSGGMDSAIVGHLMQKYSSNPIKTFSIGFPGIGGHNELEEAKESAKYIGSDHYEITINRQQCLDFLIESYQYTEEPIAIPTIPALYYVSKLASEHGKVVLSGQGADEPLGGYNRYMGEKYLSKFSNLLKVMPLQTIDDWFKMGPKFRRAAYASKFSDQIKRFVAIYSIFTADEKDRLIRPEFKDKMENVDSDLIQKLYDQTDGLTESLNKMLYIDTRNSLSDNLLLFGDKVTMANSLECRVPFLDLDFIKYVESLPASYKIKGNTHKYIHKISMEKWLPQEIIYREKRGFEVPIGKWFEEGLSDMFLQLLERDNSGCGTYFDKSYIKSLVSEMDGENGRNLIKIYTLFSFELWYDYFINNQIAENLEHHLS